MDDRAGAGVPQVEVPVAEPTPAEIVAQGEGVALHYRRMVLLVGLQILFGVGQYLPMAFLGFVGESALIWVGLAVVLIFYVAALVMAVSLVLSGYRTARHLGSRLPFLWALALVPPCINILTLLVLSYKAQTWCRQHGIEVGLLGPRKESLEAFRQRMLSSAFE